MASQEISVQEPHAIPATINSAGATPIVAPAIAPASSASPAVHALRWNKEQYLQMTELGWFEGRRVELIEGEIVEMAAMNTPHWGALILVADALRDVFKKDFFISVQSPLNMSDFSQPEPDVAVISGSPRDYSAAIPSTAALVVEISDSTLSYDRTQKAALYARAGIAEYWILNLIDNQLEIHRKPGARPDQPFGFGYLNLSFHRAGDLVSPLEAPQSSIAVADLLP